jgi:transcriptional regulator with XRE-family HTH domain
MGRAKRTTPNRLGIKLSSIRKDLGLTIDELIEKLDCTDVPLHPASISMYESGKREPPLIILLRYSRLAKVSMESLVDDEMDLSKL